MNGAKIKRSEIELYLRDMTNYIINDNTMVKSIVDDVFQEVNINSLHKRYKTKDEVKIELVSFTRNKILEYLDTYSTVEKYSEIKESLNHYAKKYVKYNMYFCRDGAPSIEKYIGVQEQIDREIDKLTTIEKEVLVRRYYFFQSSEKIAQSLDISTYKVYSIMKQLVKSLWSKVNLNADMAVDSPVDVSSLQKDMDVFFTNIANQNKGFSKQKIAEKEIKEYFLVKMLSNSKVNDIDIIFDDICLESISNVRPNDEEIDNLKYLRIYRHHSLTSNGKKLKKKRSLYRNLALVGLGGAICLSLVLMTGKNKLLVKASNQAITYNSSSSKLGLSFSYKKINNDIKIDISQNYYVNDRSVPDYTNKFDTELALSVDNDNLIAKNNNVEQTVYESASKYLSPKNEGGFKYEQGDRKYIYNEYFNILFVAEYMDGAWECTKVIFVDSINSASKYHLDSQNVLQNFYKDSNDGLWKCELLDAKDEFSEIVFEKDNSKMSNLGLYKTSNMDFKRVFDKNTGEIKMLQVNESKDKSYEDEFVTYIIEDDSTIMYYNYMEDGQLQTKVVGSIDNYILENAGEYIKENSEAVLNNIEKYEMKLPGTKVSIFPCLVNKLGANKYVSDYYEFSYYDIERLNEKNNLILKIYCDDEEKTISAYRLYNNSYYKEIKNLQLYKTALEYSTYTYFDKVVGNYYVRIFNNSFVEILEYKGKKSSVKIPSYIDGYPVKYIANNAFKFNEKIKDVVIPQTVAEIGSSSFKECENLKKVVIKGNVITIGKEAYEGCKQLKEVRVKKTPKYVGKDCFTNTKLITTLEKENGVIYFKDAALKLKDSCNVIRFRRGTKVIADGFAGENAGSISEIVLENGIKTIGNEAFMDARNINNVVLNEDINYIGAKAFKGCCNLNSIDIPAGVTIINDETFGGCVNLELVNVGTGVKVIRKKVFEDVNDDCKMTISSNTVCIFD